MTPARRHFLKMAAAQAAKEAGTEPMRSDAYELMLASLIEDRRRLKDIQSVERKVATKRELLPNYTAYVDGVLEAGEGAQDDVLMTLLVWRLDAGDLVGGLDIAEYALRFGLATPDQYQRTTAALVAEEVADESLRQLKSENPDMSGFCAALKRCEALTRNADMHDPIRAKLHKALGYALRENGDPAEALVHLNRALDLEPRIGVKKDIERLEREMKNTAKP